MTTTIKPTSWADQGDGTAWWTFDPSDVVPGVVRMADRPCDTCGGIRFIDIHDEGGAVVALHIPCPDCINGRHTWALDVALTHVEMGCTRGEVESVGGTWPHHAYRVSVVPGMVLPLVDEAAVIHGRVDMPAKCITVRHGAAHIHDGATVPGRLHPFPPDAKPGGFAVHLNWRPA